MSLSEKIGKVAIEARELLQEPTLAKEARKTLCDGIMLIEMAQIFQNKAEAGRIDFQSDYCEPETD